MAVSDTGERAALLAALKKLIRFGQTQFLSEDAMLALADARGLVATIEKTDPESAA